MCQEGLEAVCHRSPVQPALPAFFSVNDMVSAEGSLFGHQLPCHPQGPVAQVAQVVQVKLANAPKHDPFQPFNRHPMNCITPSFLLSSPSFVQLPECKNTMTPTISALLSPHCHRLGLDLVSTRAALLDAHRVKHIRLQKQDASAVLLTILDLVGQVSSGRLQPIRQSMCLMSCISSFECCRCSADGLSRVCRIVG